ncbi:PHD finger protein ing1 [Tyrophagus putrescentiae]|nr:PHD finger protein ing1 [Tyrophagus putrescentiae]
MTTSQSADQASVMYIEYYLDVMENIPSSVARVMSRIHEIDIKRTKISSLIDSALQSYLRNPLSENEKHKLLNKFLSLNVQLQNLSDTKICLAQAIYDQIEIKARQLDSQSRGLSLHNGSSSSQSNNNSSNSNSANSGNSNSYANTNGLTSSSSRGALCNNNCSSYNGSHSMNKSDTAHSSEMRSSTLVNSKDNGNKDERTGKRGVAAKRNVKNTKKTNENKKRKSSNNYDDSVYNSIDPDEPTYCTCEQVSYGEMICCDNNDCKIEWFHFSCVGLTSIPKGFVWLVVLVLQAELGDLRLAILVRPHFDGPFFGIRVAGEWRRQQLVLALFHLDGHTFGQSDDGSLLEEDALVEAVTANFALVVGRLPLVEVRGSDCTALGSVLGRSPAR